MKNTKKLIFFSFTFASLLVNAPAFGFGEGASAGAPVAVSPLAIYPAFTPAHHATINTLAIQFLNDLVTEHGETFRLLELLESLDIPNDNITQLAHELAADPDDDVEECEKTIKDAIFAAMLREAERQAITIQVPPPVPPARS